MISLILDIFSEKLIWKKITEFGTAHEKKSNQINKS